MMDLGRVKVTVVGSDLGKDKNEAPLLVIDFRDNHGNELKYYRSFSEAAWEISLDALKKIGWDP